MPFLKKAWLPLCVVLLVGFHLYIASTILRQPLNLFRHQSAMSPWVFGQHHDAMKNVGPGGDFFAVYHAGVAIQMGLPIYGIVDDQRTPYYYQFRYLPGSALLLGIPLSALSPRAAYVTWGCLLEAVFLGFGWLIFRALNGHASWRPWLLPCLIVYGMNTPFLLELQLGQFTFISTALLLAGILVVSRHAALQRKAIEFIVLAATLAGSVLVKPFSFIVLPAYASGRKYFWVAVAAVAALVLINTPYFVSHAEAWFAFKAINFGPTLLFNGFNGSNFGFLYLLYLLRITFGFSAEDADILRFAHAWQAVIFLGTAGVVVFSREKNLLLRVATMLLAYMIAYQHVWEHHHSAAVLVGLALWLSLLEADAEGLKNKRRNLIIFLSLASIAAPTWFGMLPNSHIFGEDDPSQTLAPLARAAFVACKAVPDFVLYAIAMAHLIQRAAKQKHRDATVTAVSNGYDV